MAEESATASTRALRRANAESVLRFALAVDAFDARDAMDATGLTRSTVIDHCDELIALGWIERRGDARAAGEYSKGRPARRFELRTAAGLVIGVDAGQHTVTVLVTDIRGRTLARIRRSFDGADQDPLRRSVVTTDAVDAALEAAQMPRDAVLVTVFGVPAPTDTAGRSPFGDAGYWSHMNPDLVNRFSSYGRVIVENDANLAAVAEGALGGGRGLASFAALLSGERFGAGIIIDEKLIRGRHGGAGEMRVLDLVDGVGSADGLAALARDWAREPRSGRPAPRSVTAEAVFAAADSGDTASREIVDRLGDRLARVCLVLASLLDVERVIIAGAIAEAAGTVVARAQSVLTNDFYDPVPEIVTSELGPDVVVLGAIQRGLALVRESPLAFVPLGAAEVSAAEVGAVS